MMTEKEHNISYPPLSWSQATTLEESDRIVAKQQTIPESPVLPINDGTNAGPFLTLGIIDSLEMISHKLVNDNAMTGENNLIPVTQEWVSLVIREFPKSFNRLRNVYEMYAVDEVYSILNSHNPLKRSYVFIDKSIKNYTIYSHEFQFESKKVLEETRGIKAPSIIYFPCWYLYFCNVLCTKWWNYYTRNTSNTRRATWKRYWVTGSVKVNRWNISMDLQKGVANIFGCIFHSISISCNTMQVTLCLLL